MDRTLIPGSITVRDKILSGGVQRADGRIVYLSVATADLTDDQRRQPIPDLVCALDADLQAGRPCPASIILEGAGTRTPPPTLRADVHPDAVAAVLAALRSKRA